MLFKYLISIVFIGSKFKVKLTKFILKANSFTNYKTLKIKDNYNLINIYSNHDYYRGCL